MNEDSKSTSTHSLESSSVATSIPAGEDCQKNSPLSPDFNIIEVKTEHGNVKMVPLYKSGIDIYYKNTAHGTVEPACISEVHLDDIEPYYSIRLKGDGREKQTDNDHIMLTMNEEKGEDEEGCSIATEKAEDKINEEDGMKFCCVDCFAY
mmetsp:Transcript_6355/g.11325  ORF Transcript_6355/g.11325 Transcript_6355/m.11325 type:complete len:150 (-) Transcript_6355:51-500(-)|eukprot:CAMPEP_0183729992 /NCGR_PEP_ID=MMETSP0737-20130205/31704_1 /TAXON_ID=385413 /ORGANISM="Thalassiosira miniscula, Strain CCMP1093" /LENGTH=149 /DNA_ID=CAMNT_0025962341 /DNA_START=158 /DNA_END=607 /DNA_ORIENTATION=+